MKPIVTAPRARQIYEAALKLLEDTGLEFSDGTQFFQIREKVDCTYTDGRIRFSRKNINAFFEMRRPQLCASQQHDPSNITIGGNWHSWYLCDPTTNQPRHATYQEAIDMARLAEGLGAKRCPIPVAPEKIEPKLHTLECERIALCYTREMGGCLTATDPTEIALLKDMYAVADRRYLLALEPLISPMRLNPEVMKIYLEWCNDSSIDITIFTPIPMAGATAPLVFPAALVQTLAEALALDYLFYNLSNGKLRDGFSLRLDPFDMRHGNIAFGSPEWCLCKQAIVELWNELMGGTFISGMLRTNSRVVDAQSMMERTASFLWQVELGIRHFSAVGQLCVDEVYSPVQAMIDYQLAAYANRLLRGLDSVWDDTETSAVLQEGLAQHSFLETNSTLEYFRNMFDFSRITDTSNVLTWQSAGSLSLENKAWEAAQKKIAEHTYALSNEKQQEINRLLCIFASK